MFDIITVGSATADVFVKTAMRDVKFFRFGKIHEVCYPIGSKILVEDLHFDTGGSGTNTAVAFSRLKLKTGWLGKLGNDLNSKIILEAMKKEKVTFLGKIAKGMAGYSVILVGIEKDRTILAFKGVNDQLSAKDINFKKLKTKWLYLGSMMGKSFETLKKIAQFAKKKEIPYAFNPSLYLAEKGTKQLHELIDGCTLLVLNLTEAKALIGKDLHTNDLLKKLQEHAKTVIITEGSKGAHAYDGKNKYTIIPNNIRVVETTGAGDAFASGVVAGLIKKWPLEKALQAGQAEAESVIQHIGAKQKLLTQKELLESIRKKPAKIIKSTI